MAKEKTVWIDNKNREFDTEEQAVISDCQIEAHDKLQGIMMKGSGARDIPYYQIHYIINALLEHPAVLRSVIPLAVKVEQMRSKEALRKQAEKEPEKE